MAMSGVYGPADDAELAFCCCCYRSELPTTPARDGDRLTRPVRYRCAGQADGQPAIDHLEQLVGIVVLVPPELALDPDGRQLVVIQPARRCPTLVSACAPAGLGAGAVMAAR
jgi:hypothetical protein